MALAALIISIVALIIGLYALYKVLNLPAIYS